MVSFTSKGIAIRISDRNEYGMSPKQIINEHYQFTQVNESPVYFSTNNKQDLRFNNKLEEIILFFKEFNKLNFVRAKVLRVESQKAPFIPSNSYKFSPKSFVNDARSSWYLIDKLEVVNASDLKDYEYRNNQTLQTEPLVDVLERPRFPKCYYEINRKELSDYNLFK